MHTHTQMYMYICVYICRYIHLYTHRRSWESGVLKTDKKASIGHLDAVGLDPKVPKAGLRKEARAP